jgi:parallel beta-helix repeat protein
LVVGSGNIIRGNSISSQIGTDHAGINLASCFNNSVSGNKISNSSAGISLLDCSDSTVSRNDIVFCSLGILLDSYANSNTVSGNSIHANEYGVHLSQLASYNTICENSVELNSVADIRTYASDNYIYHNNLTTSLGVIIYSGSNYWDNGYPSGGNYWSDYLTRYPNATEIDASGLGDIPYAINANNTDRYPLMAPYIPEFASSLIVPISTMATLLATIACRKKKTESEPCCLRLLKSPNPSQVTESSKHDRYHETRFKGLSTSPEPLGLISALTICLQQRVVNKCMDSSSSLD